MGITISFMTYKTTLSVTCVFLSYCRTYTVTLLVVIEYLELLGTTWNPCTVYEKICDNLFLLYFVVEAILSKKNPHFW